MIIKEGQLIANRYRVDELLGHGGMAEVYKVWDTVRSTYLAMKLLHEDLAQDRVFLERFTREAQTLAKLQHPGIVRFYGLEKEGRQAFLLLEYIEGHPLRQDLFDLNRPMEPERILRIMKPLCSALQYAHNQGYIHCDVKPSNIMLDKSGRVLLTDFGITRMAESATLTLAGAGTPAYMAPEQIKGLKPTPAMDVYALGIVLYELATGGKRPFTGEFVGKGTESVTEKIRWEKLNVDPPSPRIMNKDITPELEGVILRCLSREVNERFTGPAELFNALEAAIVNHEALPVFRKEHKKRYKSKRVDAGKSDAIKSRKNISIGFVTLFIFAFLVIAGVLIYPDFNIYEILNVSPAGESIVEINENISTSQIIPISNTPTSEDITEFESPLVESDQSAILAPINSTNAKQVGPLWEFMLDQETEGLSFIIDRDNKYLITASSNRNNIIYLDLFSGEIVDTIYVEPVSDFAISPNGEKMVFIVNSKEIYLRDQDHHDYPLLLNRPTTGTEIFNAVTYAWSTAQFAVGTNSGRIYIFNANNGELINTYLPLCGSIIDLAYTVENDSITFLCNQQSEIKSHQVSNWNTLGSSRISKILPYRNDHAIAISFSYDGRTVTTLSQNEIDPKQYAGEVWKLTTEHNYISGGPQPSIMYSNSDYYATPAVSPSGDIVVVADSKSITFFDILHPVSSSASEGRVYQQEKYAVIKSVAYMKDITHVQFSPDGTLLVIVDADRSIAVWGVS